MTQKIQNKDNSARIIYWDMINNESPTELKIETDRITFIGSANDKKSLVKLLRLAAKEIHTQIQK